MEMVGEGVRGGRGVGGNCEGGGGGGRRGGGVYMLVAWLVMRSSNLLESVSRVTKRCRYVGAGYTISYDCLSIWRWGIIGRSVHGHSVVMLFESGRNTKLILLCEKRAGTDVWETPWANC